MNVTIDEVMTSEVRTVRSDQTLGEVRESMLEGDLHAVPVVDENGSPAGMITSTDLLGDVVSDDMLVSQFISPTVYTVPRYDGVHVAARIMRNHHLHHVVVTHEKKVVGIVSSFDLLRLVEEHRFVMKQPPTPSKRKKPKIV